MFFVISRPLEGHYFMLHDLSADRQVHNTGAHIARGGIFGCRGGRASVGAGRETHSNVPLHGPACLVMRLLFCVRESKLSSSPPQYSHCPLFGYVKFGLLNPNEVPTGGLSYQRPDNGFVTCVGQCKKENERCENTSDDQSVVVCVVVWVRGLSDVRARVEMDDLAFSEA